MKRKEQLTRTLGSQQRLPALSVSQQGKQHRLWPWWIPARTEPVGLGLDLFRNGLFLQELREVTHLPVLGAMCSPKEVLSLVQVCI